jgi:hypothetical protein
MADFTQTVGSVIHSPQCRIHVSEKAHELLGFPELAHGGLKSLPPVKQSPAKISLPDSIHLILPFGLQICFSPEPSPFHFGQQDHTQFIIRLFLQSGFLSHFNRSSEGLFARPPLGVNRMVHPFDGTNFILANVEDPSGIGSTGNIVLFFVETIIAS